MIRWSGLSHLALMVVVVVTGCVSEGRPRRSVDLGPEVVEWLVLFAHTTPLDLDDTAGADSFPVKLFASRRTHAKGIRIREGLLEFLLFPGKARDANGEAAHTWRYEAKDIEGMSFVAAAGVGYNFLLNWEGTQKLPGDVKHVSLQARYTAPDGRVVLSKPLSLGLR